VSEWGFMSIYRLLFQLASTIKITSSSSHWYLMPLSIIFNECLSPLKLWVLTTFMARCTRYNICDKVCQWFVKGLWFSLGTPSSSTNKTERHDITEILLKVALNTNEMMMRWFLSEKTTDLSQIIDKLYHICCIEYTLPWMSSELTTLVVIGTHCIGSCKSNYNHAGELLSFNWILWTTTFDFISYQAMKLV
jgi:hypothetical protein